MIKFMKRKKGIFIVGIIIIILLIIFFYRLYLLMFTSLGEANYGGMYPIDENAIVEQIDIQKKEIVVKIEESDTYINSERNPYDIEKIVLDCNRLEEALVLLEDLKVSDKIVFTHTLDMPYTPQDIRILN